MASQISLRQENRGERITEEGSSEHDDERFTTRENRPPSTSSAARLNLNPSNNGKLASRHGPRGVSEQSESWRTAPVWLPDLGYPCKGSVESVSTAHSDDVFADYNHGLTRANDAFKAPSPPSVRHKDGDTPYIETSKARDPLVPRDNTSKAGGDANALPAEGKEKDNAPSPCQAEGNHSFVRARSSSSSYPTEGMRSPELIGSPPPSAGHIHPSILVQIPELQPRLSYLQSTDSLEPPRVHNQEGTPEENAEICVELSPAISIEKHPIHSHSEHTVIEQPQAIKAPWTWICPHGIFDMRNLDATHCYDASSLHSSIFRGLETAQSRSTLPFELHSRASTSCLPSHIATQHSPLHIGGQNYTDNVYVPGTRGGADHQSLGAKIRRKFVQTRLGSWLDRKVNAHSAAHRRLDGEGEGDAEREQGSLRGSSRRKRLRYRARQVGHFVLPRKLALKVVGPIQAPVRCGPARAVCTPPRGDVTPPARVDCSPATAKVNTSRPEVCA
ncbi:uncharacterized protein E0L32_010671 [Thyridium curvatum]|uniref:Uncharacterized protein n=1 Tax=Thyridium curvatum TaxID=1093900 RepID=A0A507AJZ3_9PEZI|nr:uncharacterized protein E0L32_010671 [Thyridium curvatum]TPX07673.1 hypothetical protein E0L32_010671 [Thyridium curvatum]